MSGLSETPRGNRTHIAFFGARNAGKSTLVNEFAGQDLAIVSDVAGTTTDPVSKAMEILPLGPCLITDTAGLDDVGPLGRMRVEKTLKVLDAADIAVWVHSPHDEEIRRLFDGECAKHKIAIVEYRRGESVTDLRGRIASLGLGDCAPRLLDGLVGVSDRVLCIVPIDESAPKGRLILPQQQVIRECLDRGAMCMVCRPEELSQLLSSGARFDVAITDSQAFGSVRRIFSTLPRAPRLTSFSILFARQKGDIAEFRRGLECISSLCDGDTVLISEGCTHHRQCNDIGTVKIPNALRCLSGRNLEFVFSSGGDFKVGKAALVVHCGGCMLSRREMMSRIAEATKAGIPIVNYGLVLGAVNGLRPEDIVIE